MTDEEEEMRQMKGQTDVKESTDTHTNLEDAGGKESRVVESKDLGDGDLKGTVGDKTRVEERKDPGEGEMEGAGGNKRMEETLGKR